MSGVSIEMGPAPTTSQFDQDMKLAYEGNLTTFMDRLQAISIEKAKSDAARAAAEEALAELQLGQWAQAAYEDAKTKQAAAEALCAQAEGILKLAQSDADALAAKSKADHDALIAEAQQLLDDAAGVKTARDRELAAAQDERKRLAAERDAVARRAQEVEKERVSLQNKADTIKAVVAAFISNVRPIPGAAA
jgi:hypothetical protein